MEVLAYLITVARTQLDEAAEYAPLWILTAAQRLGDAPRPHASEPLLALIGSLDAVPPTATRLDWRDLVDEGSIDFHPSWALRSRNDTAFAAAGVHRDVHLTVNDVHTLLDLVVSGLRIAAVPPPRRRQTTGAAPGPAPGPPSRARATGRSRRSRPRGTARVARPARVRAPAPGG